MDQKLLNALSNLSDGLEAIAEALKAKSGDKSPTTEALQAGSFTNSIKEINVGVKQLMADSKKILKNQETIIQLSKKSAGDKKSDFETAGGNKAQESNIKKGVGTILLIAVGVLAIGMAFKLVGNVNILSVIGLSIAIVLIAKAFEKVAALKMGLKESALASASLVFMAIGITLSSWVLSKIVTIAPVKALTAILIAGMFVVLSFGIKKLIGAFGSDIGKITKAVVFLPMILPAIALGITISSWFLSKIMPISFTQSLTLILIGVGFMFLAPAIKKIINAFKGMSWGELIKATIGLVLVLPAIALGMTISSWIMKKITPISLSQGITAILIAAVFTVISFGLKKIINAMEAVDNPAKMLLIPLLLPAVAVAIWLSSMALSKVTPIKMEQFWSALGISIIFIAFAFSLKLMASAIDKIKPASVILLPLIFVAFSVAIWLSSEILSKATVMEDDFLLKLLKTSVVMGIAFVAMGGVSYVLGKIGFTNILKGVLAIPVLATAIMLSSHILSVGNYAEYPSIGWSLGVAASLAAFGVGANLLGPLVFGPQALIFAAGLAAVLGVAATIVAASHILAKGNYAKYPSLGWSTSVALSLGAFTTGMVLLGGMIVASFGVGALALAAGSDAVLGVAQTIVDASFILAKGNWKKGPTVAWSGGVAMALAAFSPIYAMLLANGVAKIFGGGGVGPDEFSAAITTVSKGIIDAASFFADPKNKGVWKGGPTKEWAEGVGTAIGAFSPVYGMLMANGIADMIGGGGIGPEEFSSAIVTVSKGIITAAKEFAENTAPFKEGMYPSANWGQGVGGALLAFAPVFKALSEDAGFFKSSDEVISDMVNGILRIAGAIVGVAKKFSDPKLSWTSYPSKNWSEMVKGSVIRYLAVAKEIDDMGVNNWSLSVLQSTVDRMVRVAKTISTNSALFNARINPNFMKSISSNLFYYMAVAEKLSAKKGGFGSMISNAFSGDPVTRMANGMLQLAKAYDKLATSLKKIGSSMDGINDKKISQMERMSKIQNGNRVNSAASETPVSVFSGASSFMGTSVASPVGTRAKKADTGAKSGKYGDVGKQNDLIIDLLTELNNKLGPGSVIDAMAQKKLAEKKDSSLQ